MATAPEHQPTRRPTASKANLQTARRRDSSRHCSGRT
ncbi:hypothetical protein EYF80_051694 [Liparis tanakae]|uniref:Uncharacterized protein n=1 Tax=Liparis tanakae TaxID=230148 RepID=A0A4Z2FCL6_9TELE|nr:hypothetical protein EYF80_051694 [Liparis tanakae]